MRWFIAIVFFILLEIYALQAFRVVFPKFKVTLLYICLSLILYVLVLGSFVVVSETGFNKSNSLILGVFLSVVVLKLGIIFFMIIEDITRLIRFLFQSVFDSSAKPTFPSRRKFVSTLALGVSAIPFVSLLYGMYKGKYNYKVLTYTMDFKDLPTSFHGFKIVQVSDIHSGSLDNIEKVQYGIDLINQQQADLICFTGDLVNNIASEMDKWKPLFSQLKAKYGIYSVLGNHDYGDYYTWNNEVEKKKNFQGLIQVHQEMGWQLLRNENATIHKDKDKISIVGVENWGKGGFTKKGDLDLASKNLTAKDFKILLSHDPSHWDLKVKEDPKHFQLTLSGHTHGMQFGIEIPGWIKWSPAKYRYTQWAGIYQHNNRVINVNRGFGYLAYPGRVGIWPEITTIELTTKI